MLSMLDNYIKHKPLIFEDVSVVYTELTLNIQFQTTIIRPNKKYFYPLCSVGNSLASKATSCIASPTQASTRTVRSNGRELRPNRTTTVVELYMLFISLPMPLKLSTRRTLLLKLNRKRIKIHECYKDVNEHHGQTREKNIIIFLESD